MSVRSPRKLFIFMITIVQVCLDNSDWSGVAKVSELEWIPSYWDTIQSTSRVPSPESRSSYSRFRVMKVRVIETHLYLQDHLKRIQLSFEIKISAGASGFVVAEILVTPSWKSCIVIILKIFFLDQSIWKISCFILKTEALVPAGENSDHLRDD